MDFQQRYKFDSKTDLLGKGGFSKVFKATDTLLERTVALKFFTGTISDKYQVLNEIKKVIRFEHPNLCKYYDVEVLSYNNVLGETEQIEVGIMEYIDSGDFKTYTRKNPRHVDKLLIDVLKGLHYLHRHGIAHRDLKPQNILVKTDENEPIAKITDFGISKLMATDDTNSSALLGTIEYMAPEQFNPAKYGINGRVTTNLDLWSFGLLVYEAVCHETFFGSRSGGVSAEQVMVNILGEASLEKVEKIPGKYREIVMKCLVKNAAERVQSALELIPLFETGNERNADRNHRDHNIPYVGPDDTKLFETEAPTEDETGESITKRAVPLEDTQVLSFDAEYSTHSTQVIDYLPDTSSEQSQTNDQTQEITAPTQVIAPVEEFEISETRILEVPQENDTDITQVIEPVTGIDDEVVNVVHPNTSQADARDVSANRQIDKKAEPGKRKSLNKSILLASIAALIIISFIAYPLLNQPNRLPEPTRAATQPSDRPTILVEDWKPALISVGRGIFVMGDLDANGASSASYAHEVAVGPFSIGKYEVTVAQFKKFIDEKGYVTTAELKGSSSVLGKRKWEDRKGVNWRYNVKGDLLGSGLKSTPVVYVSWTDANAYCEWLSQKTGETYRLLTEAEWEFAAKGGNRSKQYAYSGSDSINLVGWHIKNSDSSIHFVGTRQPNELGIYDMSGNALEWCNDWYGKDYYRNSPVENPGGPANPEPDSAKVLRGGAWAYEGKVSRNVYRTKFGMNINGGSTGFRVCRVDK